ncbi:hypothetical protein L1987_63050 [Smallanthus sonchifolius]|uniref:Uncharacterized protein n=1 Tax=Smallanthus sonchifolius TaxID=185202 RepID=A0ACB9CC41_9ASTR|nr:hypothetical protein L1987_63050 [Smallanthus sonchifolius]
MDYSKLQTLDSEVSETIDLVAPIHQELLFFRCDSMLQTLDSMLQNPRTETKVTGAQYVGKRYLLTYDFIIDVLAALPLPQFAVLVIIPSLDGQSSISKENVLKFIIFCQYIPRVIQTSLLYKKFASIFGFLIDVAWVRAAYNLLFYVLASHVVGALWYFFAIESELRCWHNACKRHNCQSKYLYCGESRVGDYGFLNTSCPLLERSELKNSTDFDFGIYLDAFQTHVLERIDIRKKILYCSLWGLQNLRTGFYHASNLKAGDLCGEELFSWALDHKTPQLPFSTRTVKAVTDVQAFALVADDLLFLASQFRSFHSTTHITGGHGQPATYRLHGGNWKRKQENILEDKSKRLQDASGTSTLSLGASIYVSRFSSNSLRNLRRNHDVDVSTPKLELMLQKPTQPMMQQSLPLGKMLCALIACFLSSIL